MATDYQLIGLEPFQFGWTTRTQTQWCHVECHERFTALNWHTRGFLGDHVHWNSEHNTWMVPGEPYPLLNSPDTD